MKRSVVNQPFWMNCFIVSFLWIYFTVTCPLFGQAKAPTPFKAEKTTTPPAKSTVDSTQAISILASASHLSVEELQAKIQAAKSSTSLTQEIKTQIEELCKQAVLNVTQMNKVKGQTKTLTEELEKAPDRIKQITAVLEQPTPKVSDQLSETAKAMTIEQVAQRLREIKSTLANAKLKANQYSEEADNQRSRPEKLLTEISDKKKSLEKIQEQLKATPPENEPAALTEARQMTLKIAQQLRQVELAYLEQERLGNDLRIKWLQSEHDLINYEMLSLEKQIKSWDDIHLKKQAASAKASLEKAQKEVSQASEILKPLAKVNEQLTEKNSELTQRLETLNSEISDVKDHINSIETEFALAKKRIKEIGLDQDTSARLRRFRSTLPTLSEHRENAKDRRDEMRETDNLRFKLEQYETDLKDIDEQASEIVSEIELSLTTDQKQALQSEAVKILKSRKKIIKQLKAQVEAFNNQLYERNTSGTQRVILATEFAVFIDKHLMWARSARRIDKQMVSETRDAVTWICSGKKWKQAWGDAESVVLKKPVYATVLLMLWATLMLCRPLAKKKMSQINQRLRSIKTDSFKHTFNVFLLSVLRILPIPALLWVMGQILNQSVSTMQFTHAIGYGLTQLALYWLLLGTIKELCHSNGLGKNHFKWTTKTCSHLHVDLCWLMLAVLPFSFIANIVEGFESHTYLASLGRLAFMLNVIILMIFFGVLVHPSSKLFNAMTEKGKLIFLIRFRYFWYIAIGLLLVSLPILAADGYYYTARRLAEKLTATAWLSLFLVVLYCLIIRWLYIGQRQLLYTDALRKAEEARKQRLENEEKGIADSSGGENDPLVVEEPEIDFKKIDQQTRRFVHSIMLVFGLMGLWGVWASVFPILEVLNRVHLWQYSAIVDGVPHQDYITLANLFLVVIIIMVTTAAAKNLPGLTELVLLNRLPLDAGARYAFSTIIQYVISGIGIIAVFKTIHVGWDNVQWLVAALSVGLGFGLQEIVANFVSGIILLFERPIRVGDVVTINGTTGVVSRIRIRATTITNWDRQELIMPNKSFITGELLNWTLTNQINRIVIPVGVAYGTDTELARKVMLQCVKEHPDTLDDPVPGCTFDEFGDSALNLTVRCCLSDMSRRLDVIHELHTAIDKACQQSNIEIAFPQKDIHFRGPLEIARTKPQSKDK